VSALNEGVNRIRLLKRQASELQKRIGDDHKALRERAAALVAPLEAIEAVLVDVNRETPRDVLRNPAGLNDTLGDMIGAVAIADAAPTVSTRAVSDEVMAQVDSEIAKLDKLVAGDVAALNAALRAAGIDHIGGLAHPA
jgi:hypothetical protein